MTLQVILTRALQRLNRPTDSKSISKHKGTFIFYINEAVKIIAEKYRQQNKETVTLTNYVFAATALTYRCAEVISVLADGESVSFTEEYAGSRTFEVDTDEATVEVVYRFIPPDLSNNTDEPLIPEEYHGMIVNYVVANERANGDPDLQNAASLDFQLFQDKLRRVRPSDIPTKLTGYFT